MTLVPCPTPSINESTRDCGAVSRCRTTWRAWLRARFPLAFVDGGGGFGIDYGSGCPVRPADFIRKQRKLNCDDRESVRQPVTKKTANFFNGGADISLPIKDSWQSKALERKLKDKL